MIIPCDTIFRGYAFGPAAHAAGYAFFVALRVSAGMPRPANNFGATYSIFERRTTNSPFLGFK